jgi:hypothetical protein
MPIIPVLYKLRQEDQEFEASLNYVGKSCLKNKTKVWHQWLTPVTLATHKAEMRRITV